MDVDLIFKIAAIGIIVAVLNQLLIRSGREEQAMMTTLAGLIVVLMMVIQEIDTLFSTVKSVFVQSARGMPFDPVFRRRLFGCRRKGAGVARGICGQDCSGAAGTAAV